VTGRGGSRQVVHVVVRSRSFCGPWGVELRDEFSVCGSGGIEVLVVLFELEAKVDGVLFERDDLLFELIDAIGRAEARLVPGLFAECFGEALFELVDAGGETNGALLRVEQVGLEGRSADRGSDAGGVRWLGFGGVDLFENVVVAVDEAAIDAGDAADLVAVVGGVVEDFENALAANSGGCTWDCVRRIHQRALPDSLCRSRRRPALLRGFTPPSAQSP